MPLWGFAMLAVLGTAAIVVWSATPAETAPAPAYTPAAQPAAKPAAPTLPPNVTVGFPAGETGYTIAIDEDRLMAGRMMLVNETHPVPEGFMPPASYSMLERTKGRVACRDAYAVLAGDALEALDELFRYARYARHRELVVFAASRPEEQQRTELIERMGALSITMSFEEALAQAKREIELPGHSEHQLPWCVDIRLCDGWNDLPSGEALSASPAGQWLLTHAWEYGFIQRYPDAATDSHRAWHFRYVGKGHAAMMHALSLTMEEYLLLIRRHEVLTLIDDAGEPAVTVICRPMTAGETRFTLPLHGTVEDVSTDNDGWAVVSCLYQ